MAETIPFHCPACGAKRDVPRALAGRRASCPECNQLVEISAAAASSSLSEIDPKADTLVVPPPDGIENSFAPTDATPPPGESTSHLPPQPPPPPSDYVDRLGPDDFDPYYRWLAIPKSEQPANHYRLLGLPLFESDPDVILNSSERQMAHIKAQAGGRYLVICQKLLSELSLARICLLDSEKKKAYDVQLRAKQKPRFAGQKNLAAKQSKPSPEVSTPPKGAPRPASRFEAGPSVVAYKQAGADDETALEVIDVVAEPEAPPVAPPVHVRWKGAPETPPSGPTSGTDEAEESPDEVKFTRRPVEGEMDMTPMIDVTFLLLIFFICTASFALIMTKEIPAPKEEDEPSTNVQTIEEFEDDPDYITIRIDAYNTFRVITPDLDEEAPSYQELLLKLRAARQGGANGKIPTSLMVIVNGLAKHKTQVMALDAGTEVGMEKMQLMTVENDDE